MTTACLAKAVRDLWRERVRTGAVALAIALALAAFVAVISSYAILRRELNRGYLATAPASVVIDTDAIDAGLLAAVQTLPGVAVADGRARIDGRIRTKDGRWRRLVIFVIRDFFDLRVSTITRDAGAWPPAPGEMLIERDAFQVARAGIGDEVTIRINDAYHRLRIAGGVHDAGQAQARMEDCVYAYITPQTHAQLTAHSNFDRLLLLVRGDRFDAATLQAVAAGVQGWLRDHGHAVRSVTVPPPGQHPHAAIMGVLLVAIAAFGGLALILAGIITTNLLMAMIAAERRQIAVMRALGATAVQIGRLYIGEAALLGIAAIAIALPIGRLGAVVLARRFATLLNFDLLDRGAPVWVYLVAIAVGLAVAVAAASFPVSRALAISVRDGLSPAVVDPLAPWVVTLERLLARVATGLWANGVRNTLRRPGRTLISVGTLTAAGTFFITALSVRASMMAGIDALFGAGTFGAASRYALDQHMVMIYVFLLTMAALLASVGGLGLMTAISLNVIDRRRELAVLRALGATPGRIALVVTTEAVVVTTFASLLAIAAAWPITAGVLRLMTAVLFPRGFNPLLSPLAIATWVAVSLALAAIASIGPAVAASRCSVREVLAYE